MIWIASWGIENINYLITWDHFRCACPCVFNSIVFFLRMYLDNFKWAPAKQNDPFRYVLCTTISRLHCQHLSKASREISSFLSQKIRGSLRENEKQDDDYSIPYDNCFDYVSSLHYLAEIISLSSISSTCITSPITSTIPCICASYLLLSYLT